MTEDSIHKMVSELELLRQKNDLLLLVSGWLIGTLMKEGIEVPEDVVKLLRGIGLNL